MKMKDMLSVRPPPPHLQYACRCAGFINAIRVENAVLLENAFVSR